MSLQGAARQTVCCLRLNRQQGLQHALDRFSVACDRDEMKIGTKNTEVLRLSTYPRQCMRQYTAAAGEVQVPRGGVYE